MNIIAATDSNNAIGYKNNLLYKIKEDKEYFKKITTGKIIVMGRKTFESLPNKKPLPNRTNIIFTRNKNFSAENCILVNSKEDFFKLCKKNNFKSEDIFIIGGSEIYKLFLDDCEKFYITEIISENKNADAYFPVKFQKKPVFSTEWKDFENGKFRFTIYKEY